MGDRSRVRPRRQGVHLCQKKMSELQSNIQCPCGEALGHHQKFCSKCGERVLSEGKKRCGNCPKILKETAKYCSVCGTNQPTLPNQTKQISLDKDTKEAEPDVKPASTGKRTDSENTSKDGKGDGLEKYHKRELIRENRRESTRGNEQEQEREAPPVDSQSTTESRSYTSSQKRHACESQNRDFLEQVSNLPHDVQKKPESNASIPAEELSPCDRDQAAFEDHAANSAFFLDFDRQVTAAHTPMTGNQANHQFHAAGANRNTPECVMMSYRQQEANPSQYHFSQKTHCQLQANGVLRYSYTERSNQNTSRKVVALLMTQRPIRPIYSNHLEIEIMDVGRIGGLSVGIVPLNYGQEHSSGRQPGWDENSVGYHADNGRIYLGYRRSFCLVSTCDVGDRMGVGVILPAGDSPSGKPPMFFFTKNGQKIFESKWDALEDGSHHLAVGMVSAGEAVRLLDSDMWLLENEEDLMKLTQVKKLSSSPSQSAQARAGVAKTGPSGRDSGLPRYWDLSANSNELCQLITITKTDSFHEYEKIEMQFFETLSRDKFRILSIRRIQNPDLYQIYQFCKLRMERRSAVNAVEEKFLFHGTKQEHIEAICHQGFDFRVCGSSIGCLYGRGSYFAKAANYSRNYTDSQQLFVARVLVGHYTKGESFHKRPPPKDPEHPFRESFDSCVDDMKNPQIYVVFSIEQAYPEYLIDFQKI